MQQKLLFFVLLLLGLFAQSFGAAPTSMTQKPFEMDLHAKRQQSDCGNGVLNPPEECDDGNTNDLDGCNATCGIESGWACQNSTNPASNCMPICGDAIIVGLEECDDGNLDDDDDCDNSCETNPDFVVGRLTAAALSGIVIGG